MHLTTLRERYNKKDGSLYGKKNIENSIAMLYHENSKFTSHTLRLEGEIIGGFNNPYVISRASQPYKCYATSKRIDLSVYAKGEQEANLFKVLRNRRSIREYDKGYKLSLNELTILLYNSYGVTRKSKIAGVNVNGHIGLRNIPSGGGLYPLELYVVVFNAHIPSGLYHYRPDVNSLEVIKEGDFMEELLGMIQAEPYVKMRTASALIISTGIIERILIKYGDRGYRFLMQESGFVGQTISLLAEAINLSSCMIGGYNDDKVNNFLGVDGVFETINNIIVIGKKKDNSNSCEL